MPEALNIPSTLPARSSVHRAAAAGVVLLVALAGPPTPAQVGAVDGPATTIGSQDPDLDLRAKPELSAEVLEALPDLESRIPSPDWHVRDQVVTDLWELRPRGLSELIYLVGDPQVGNHAANVVWQWYLHKGIEVPVAPVLEILRTAPCKGRHNAAYLLTRMRAAEAAPLLAEVSRTDDPTVVQAALPALGASNPELGREIAEEVLVSHESRFARDGAVRCLAATANAESGPLLLRCLDDPLPYIREYCAYGLRRIGYRPAIPRLIKMLADEAYSVRAAAAQAFTSPELASPDALPALVGLLGEGEPYGYAIKALAVLGDQRAVRPLYAAIDPTNKGKTEWVLGALGRIGGPEAARAVAEAAQAGISRPYALGVLVHQLAIPEVIPQMLSMLRSMPWDGPADAGSDRGQTAAVIAAALGVTPRTRDGADVEGGPVRDTVQRWIEQPADAPAEFQPILRGLGAGQQMTIDQVWTRDDLAVVDYSIRGHASSFARGGRILLQHDGEWTLLAMVAMWVE